MADLEIHRGEPTPPIAFGVPGGAGPSARTQTGNGAESGEQRSPIGALPVRLAGRPVEVDEALLERLCDVCAEVTTADDVRNETGRDWWPLALTWAVGGRVPARAAAVARPGSPSEVAAVLAACGAAGVPVTAAAGRSGVCGASIPVFGGVLLDLCGLHGIVAVDQQSLLLDVRPGTFGDILEDELRAEHRVTLGHWPQSMALSTVGGWLACRGAGQYSTRYGKIEDMVVGLEVALADGRIIRTGTGAPRAAAGPDLTQLFVGSEGTLGVITQARLRVHPLPPAERRAAYGFSSFHEGLDACRRVLRRGATPAVLRLYDHRESTRNFQVDRCVLLTLDEGEPEIIDAVMRIIDEECRTGSDRLDDELVETWMGHRNDVSALPALVKAGIVLDTIEIAARWSSIPSIYDDAMAALSSIDGVIAASAHQSHAYSDGACLYFTWAARLPEGAAIGGVEGEALYTAAWDAVTAVTLAHSGAISHHHGIGLNRSRYMPEALGAGFDVLAAIKTTLDPRGILNPGKLGLSSPFGDVGWPR